jgi:ABC-type sugar transport system permease subunit
MSLVFCGPAVVLYGGFVILPAILGFTYSLTDWNGWSAGGDGSNLWGAFAGLLRLAPGDAVASLSRRPSRLSRSPRWCWSPRSRSRCCDGGR